MRTDVQRGQSGQARLVCDRQGSRRTGRLRRKFDGSADLGESDVNRIRVQHVGPGPEDESVASGGREPVGAGRGTDVGGGGGGGVGNSGAGGGGGGGIGRLAEADGLGGG